MREGRDESNPNRGSGLGRIVAVIVMVAALGAVAWSVMAVPIGEGMRVPRYEASNLDVALLPPSWLTPNARDRERLDALRERVLRKADDPGASTASTAPRAGVPVLLLGSDRLGRDVLARVIAGGAVSLAIGLVAAAITVIIGTLWGVAAGVAGGRTDAIMMRIVDVLFGLPSILLVVLLAVAVDGAWLRFAPDPQPLMKQAINLLVLMAAIGGVSWLTMARVVRGEVLSLKARPFMESCRAMAVPWGRQLRRHLLPNLVGPIMVYAALAVPAAILTESLLSFLGIGVQPPVPSWGNLASEGLSELNLVRSRWWLLAAPCIAVGTALLLLNLAGDRIRERLDPMRRVRSGR